MSARVQYSNSTPGRKFVTGNGFGDPDFFYDVNISPINMMQISGGTKNFYWGL